MVTYNEDGSIDVQVWVHPRSVKTHILTTCRALARMQFDRPAILHFDDLETAQEWFESMQNTEGTCRWCFPTPLAPDSVDVPDAA